MKTCLLKSKIFFFLCVALILLFPAFGYSQEEEIAKYPSRPITLIYSFVPGISGDLATRLISKEAEKFLGKPIVVLNKPGAAGAIGHAALAASQPDGYTIGSVGHSPMITLPILENVPYHPRDFKFIMQFSGSNMGISVKADSPFKSFKDIIAYARQNPKKLTYGTVGVQSIPFILMKQISKKEGVQFTHIPFKGGDMEAERAMLGGHLIFYAGGFTYGLHEAGQLRILLLFTEERSVEYPQAPILKDLGYDFLFPSLNGVAAPKGIPEGIAKKLEEAFNKAIKQPAFIKGMENIHAPIIYRNSKEFTEYITYNYNYFEKLLKEIDLKE